MIEQHLQIKSSKQNRTQYSTSAKLLTYISLQFFVTTLLLIVSQFKHEIYQNIAIKYDYLIYFAYIVLVASVVALKYKGGKRYALDLALFVSITLSMSWCIIYFCAFYTKEQVLNCTIALFGSVFGMRVYAKTYNCDFQDKVDQIGGLISSTVGVVIAINLMSFTFVPFGLISTIICLTLAILFSLTLMNCINLIIEAYGEADLRNPLQNASIFYWQLPKYVLSSLKCLCIKIIDYEYI